MMYLKKYNFTDSDINDLKALLTENSVTEFSIYESRVSELIEYFLDLGIKNIKGVILAREDLFYESKKLIQEAFENSSVTNIVELINEDPAAFELIGL